MDILICLDLKGNFIGYWEPNTSNVTKRCIHLYDEKRELELELERAKWHIKEYRDNAYTVVKASVNFNFNSK